jgi:hypothetical protein
MQVDTLRDPTPTPTPPQVTYPPILPISEYDLLTDPTHRYGKQGLQINDDPAVLVPNINVRFQLARESPPHLGPHNATPLGFIRYIPTNEALGKRIPKPRGASSLKFYHAKMQYESVLFAFMYT